MLTVERARLELQLRITELRDEVMLNSYLDKHAEEQAYEVSESSHRNRLGLPTQTEPHTHCPTISGAALAAVSQEELAQEAGL